MKNINLKLIDLHNEVGNIKTFSFDTNGLKWLAGQYQAYFLPQAGDDKKDNLHYFTISSAPSENRINLSTRMTGSKFKTALNNLKIGDSIETSNLGGNFVWEDDREGPIVLVAAGIGVTPYRSMLIERLKNNRKIDAKLIYFNRNDEIAFLDSFKKIAETHPEFKLMPIVGERVSAESILKLAPEAKEGIVYISGPESMVEKIGNELKEMNILVKLDWFPGYTNDNF